MQEYVVNNRDEKNPNENHEVHTKKHALERHIESYTSLGICENAKEAVQKAKKLFSDADGCKICCSEAHKE